VKQREKGKNRGVISIWVFVIVKNPVLRVDQQCEFVFVRILKSCRFRLRPKKQQGKITGASNLPTEPIDGINCWSRTWQNNRLVSLTTRAGRGVAWWDQYEKTILLWGNQRNATRFPRIRNHEMAQAVQSFGLVDFQKCSPLSRLNFTFFPPHPSRLKNKVGSMTAEIRMIFSFVWKGGYRDKVPEFSREREGELRLYLWEDGMALNFKQ
jgi:hypothetical protein